MTAKPLGVLRRLCGVAILPLLCLLLTALACAVSGTTLFTGYSTWQLFVRGLSYVLLLSFGMSVNMHTGRFDFAAGAVMLLAGVIGARAAMAIGGGPWVMLLVSALMGALIGCGEGWLYVLFRLPPMIIGLGLTLILEGITAIITDGCKPVGFGTDASFYRFAVEPRYLIPIMAVSLLLMVFLFHYTTFGYDYHALRTGQKIAVQTGVSEEENAVLCYTVAGLFFGAAGALAICSTNGITPTVNFSTIASIFSCFLPLFFSGFIERYCNKQLAVFFGCVSYEFIQIAFGQISFVRSGFSPNIYSMVEAVILVLFLIYLNNGEVFSRGVGYLRRQMSARTRSREKT